MTEAASYDESIQEAVARETARRKRVLMTFMALLVVPIAIGSYALTKAPTETDIVADKVTPVVTDRVEQSVGTRVMNEVVTKTTPLIRDSVSREFSATVAPRIASVADDAAQLRGSVDGLGQEIKTLQTTVQSSSEFVAAATPQLKALPELQDRLTKVSAFADEAARTITTLRSDDDTIRQQLDENRAVTKRLSDQQAQFNSRFSEERERAGRLQADFRDSLGKELASINHRLDRLNESVKTASLNRDTLNTLIQRVEDVEKRLGNLERQVKKPNLIR